MDLFNSLDKHKLPGTPLPERLRPQHLDQIVGQSKAIQQIQNYLLKKHLPSLILWGPPGTGKTTIARSLAKEFDAQFVALNAVESGAKILKEQGEQARERRLQYSQKTILFVDEIHRFNKAQQDVLLPFVESGDLILIGATTENPSYELNRALLSRCRLIVLERLSESELTKILHRALEADVTSEKLFTPEALAAFLVWCDGDARRLLATLEEIQLQPEQMLPLTRDGLTEVLGRQALGYDRASDQHYDTISAFIKSIRGSDPDAALYYLARMVRGGEDPVFIARRLVILASEDVGNADPRAIQVAISGAQAVEMIGWPEAGINLAQVVCYLASAPKSNRAYEGYNKALALVDQTGTLPIPLHLRSSKTAAMKDLGYGKAYQYPHSHARGWAQQSYLPESLQQIEKLYVPSSHGFEKQIQQYLDWLHGQPKTEENKSEL